MKEKKKKMKKNEKKNEKNVKVNECQIKNVPLALNVKVKQK